MENILHNLNIIIIFVPRKRKIGRVIECAGLEIRYTAFWYRGFESLIFRKRMTMQRERGEDTIVFFRLLFFRHITPSYRRLQIMPFRSSACALRRLRILSEKHHTYTSNKNTRPELTSDLICFTACHQTVWFPALPYMQPDISDKDREQIDGNSAQYAL